MERTETIIAAVKRHHGGMDAATDEQCWIIWHALPRDVQERYLSEATAPKLKIGNNYAVSL